MGAISKAFQLMVSAHEMLGSVGIVAALTINETSLRIDLLNIPDIISVKYIEWLLHSFSYWTLYSCIASSVLYTVLSYFDGERFAGKIVPVIYPVVFYALAVVAFFLHTMVHYLVMSNMNVVYYNHWHDVPQSTRQGFIIVYAIPQTLNCAVLIMLLCRELYLGSWAHLRRTNRVIDRNDGSVLNELMGVDSKGVRR